MSRLAKIIKKLLTSRLAVALCLLHLILFCYTIFEKPAAEPPTEDGPYWAGVSYFAGRYFHLAYESTLYQIITILDLPAMFVAMIPTAPVVFLSKALGLSFSVYVESWLIALIVLLAASLQWLAIGYLLEGFVKQILGPGRHKDDH